MPTTHVQPTFVLEERVHYCATNMPDAVPRTSTFALNAAALPFILGIASKGLGQALADDTPLKAGLNVHQGEIVHPAVIEALAS